MPHAAGARLHMACGIAGIDVRTLQRWRVHGGLTAGDGRPQAVRPLPGHALSEAERAELVSVADEPRLAAVVAGNYRSPAERDEPLPLRLSQPRNSLRRLGAAGCQLL